MDDGFILESFYFPAQDWFVCWTQLERDYLTMQSVHEQTVLRQAQKTVTDKHSSFYP